MYGNLFNRARRAGRGGDGRGIIRRGSDDRRLWRLFNFRLWRFHRRRWPLHWLRPAVRRFGPSSDRLLQPRERLENLASGGSFIWCGAIHQQGDEISAGADLLKPLHHVGEPLTGDHAGDPAFTGGPRQR